MSVEELFRFQEDVLRDWVARPRAWLIMANPVWGSTETVNRIAIFDTKEAAEAYWKAALLPEVKDKSVYLTDDRILRSFRPDSLLWDYNDHTYSSPAVVPAIPWRDYAGVTRNPSPPAGPIANGPKEWGPRGVGNLSDFSTNPPRYGKDFDQGFGGPRSDMNHVLPSSPPAAAPKGEPS